MASASKWLHWEPADKQRAQLTTDKTAKSAITTVPARTSVSSVSAGMEEHDHLAWAEDFDSWALTDCRYQENGCQSMSSLHVAFAEWAIQNHSVPCRRDVFEQLLSSGGFSVSDGLVLGLMLVSDYRALEVSR
jgi:hypothetical protein